MLTQALWPGGQIISDEALTPVIFRARSALGPYVAHLRTVRGVGVRLDIAVTHLPVAEPALGKQASAQRSEAESMDRVAPGPRRVIRRPGLYACH